MGAGDLSPLVEMVSTHYLYYLRPWWHMTVPRKITIQTTQKESLVLTPRKEHYRTLLVGTVHKPRQGGINSVPLRVTHGY